jgi:hypothetical protein
LLEPITEKYFGKGQEFNLETIYNEVFSLEGAKVEALKQEVSDMYAQAQLTFQDAPDEDVEFLRIFSFICVLSYDVYVKKLLIEKLVDEIRKNRTAANERNGKKEK